MAVEAYFNAETVWTSDIDKYASIVIKERIGKPNLGDLKVIDWKQVEQIDILTAGYPCQPFSTAGSRKGTDDKRHIFPYIMEAISVLKPRIIILENVRGHLTLGFKEVLERLASAGYDAKWRIVRASDAGAPHQRARLFVCAYPKGGWAGGQSIGISTKNAGLSGGYSEALQCSNTDSFRQYMGKQDKKWCQRQSQSFATSLEQNIFSRKVPNPLDEEKLNVKYVEYLMGLPEGWVTDLDISRSQQLKILGNGVVPQQAYLALQLLLGE